MPLYYFTTTVRSSLDSVTSWISWKLKYLTDLSTFPSNGYTSAKMIVLESEGLHRENIVLPADENPHDESHENSQDILKTFSSTWVQL